MYSIVTNGTLRVKNERKYFLGNFNNVLYTTTKTQKQINYLITSLWYLLGHFSKQLRHFGARPSRPAGRFLHDVRERHVIDHVDSVRPNFVNEGDHHGVVLVLKICQLQLWNEWMNGISIIFYEISFILFVLT